MLEVTLATVRPLQRQAFDTHVLPGLTSRMDAVLQQTNRQINCSGLEKDAFRRVVNEDEELGSGGKGKLERTA